MSRLTEELRHHQCYNPYNFAGRGNPYIYYVGNTGSWLGPQHCWVVSRPGYHTNTKSTNLARSGDQEFRAQTYDTEAGKFLSPAEGKRRALAAAQAWAGERYGITEWEKTPYGTFMRKGFSAERIAELRAQVEVSSIEPKNVTF